MRTPSCIATLTSPVLRLESTEGSPSQRTLTSPRVPWFSSASADDSITVPSANWHMREPSSRTRTSVPSARVVITWCVTWSGSGLGLGLG